MFCSHEKIYNTMSLFSSGFGVKGSFDRSMVGKTTARRKDWCKGRGRVVGHDGGGGGGGLSFRRVVSHFWIRRCLLFAEGIRWRAEWTSASIVAMSVVAGGAHRPCNVVGNGGGGM